MDNENNIKSTNYLCDKIVNAAIKKENDKIDSILWKAHSDIGLKGTSINVELKDSKGTTTINVSSSYLIQALTLAQCENVKESVAAKSINDFLERFSEFRSFVKDIEK